MQSISLENIIYGKLHPSNSPKASAPIIYKTSQQLAGNEAEETKYETQYVQVRVKNIEYLEAPALAVYF